MRISLILLLPFLFQEGEALRESMKDNISKGWVYDSIEGGFKRARKSGKPLLISFR